MADRRRFKIGIAALLLALMLDQFSKWLLLDRVGIVSSAIEVAPFFNLVMVWNTGISFGMLAEHDRPYLLVALSLIIIAVLAVWLRRAESALTAAALGLVIGGALGNIIDRLRFGAVADFFDFHIGAYHWPAFNIADSAIFIGVVLLCAEGILRPDKKP